MASFKEKLDKNGNRIYEVQASNGRGRRVWRTFRPEPTWSKRTIQRELQKFAAELEQQLADGEVLTREETAQKAAAEAVEAAKIKTFRQYAEAVYLPEKAATLAEKTRASYTQLLEQHVFPALGHVLLPEITPAMIKALLSSLSEELAFASVTKVYAVLHNLFKAALLDDTIDRNPMDKVPRPRKRLLLQRRRGIFCAVWMASRSSGGRLSCCLSIRAAAGARPAGCNGSRWILIPTRSPSRGICSTPPSGACTRLCPKTARPAL